MNFERPHIKTDSQTNPWANLKDFATPLNPEESTPSVTNANLPQHEDKIDQHAPAPLTNTPRAPRYEGDPSQYSEAELLADPIKRFRVNPEDFRLFARQTEITGIKDGRIQAPTKPLDANLGEYVACTADTISVITGHDQGMRLGPARKGEHYDTPADHVIYLDKSARPVCWLVNTFWDDFTDEKRPPHSFLAIDRADWLRRMGFNCDDDGRDLATGDKITPHALFVPGGVETEDPDTILQLPTVLDGKNVLVVDEVARTGSTQSIAQMALKAAIPAIKQTQSYTFWRTPGAFTYVKSNGNTESEIASAPIWYDAKTPLGRGIGDVSQDFFAERYAKHPNPHTRAQMLGSFALGRYINLNEEAGHASRELAHEIQNLHHEYEQGHILMAAPYHYDLKAWKASLEKLGIQFARRNGNQPLPHNSLPYIKDELSQRPPAFA